MGRGGGCHAPSRIAVSLWDTVVVAQRAAKGDSTGVQATTG